VIPCPSFSLPRPSYSWHAKRTSPSSKLTILYNSGPPVDGLPGDAATLPHPPDSTCVSRPLLSQFLESYAEPVSVRASTWLCFRASLGSFAFWSGPVLKKTWADAQPAYTAQLRPGGGRDRGFGCQAYVSYGHLRGGFSVFCVSSLHSSLSGLFSVRWSARFPCIVPEQAEIFDFVRTGNLAAVQLMFSAGKATPWDTALDGRGLLHVSLGTRSHSSPPPHRPLFPCGLST